MHYIYIVFSFSNRPISPGVVMFGKVDRESINRNVRESVGESATEHILSHDPDDGVGGRPNIRSSPKNVYSVLGVC